MQSYMYQPRRSAGIRAEANVARFGPNEVLRCPATIIRKDCRIVCGKGFGRTNEYGRAEVRVASTVTAGLMHPGFYHKCRGCGGQLEVIIRNAEARSSDVEAS